MRVAEQHVCSEPGRAKECSYLEFPIAVRSFQNPLNFHKLHPLADLDVIPARANVLLPTVRITRLTGLGGNPTEVSIVKSTSQAPACR
jgi:hypothetical protein